MLDNDHAEYILQMHYTNNNHILVFKPCSEIKMFNGRFELVQTYMQKKGKEEQHKTVGLCKFSEPITPEDDYMQQKILKI